MNLDEVVNILKQMKEILVSSININLFTTISGILATFLTIMGSSLSKLLKLPTPFGVLNLEKSIL